jgi:hypothetical protein
LNEVRIVVMAYSPQIDSVPIHFYFHILLFFEQKSSPDSLAFRIGTFYQVETHTDNSQGRQRKLSEANSLKHSEKTSQDQKEAPKTTTHSPTDTLREAQTTLYRPKTALKHPVTTTPQGPHKSPGHP